MNINIFIIFYISATLIGLNSSTFVVHIQIDKSGLKSELKNFEGKDGQFILKIAKKSENGKWEIDPENKSVRANSDVFVPLEVPKKWEPLWDNHIMKNKPFLLAVKVEMAENKSIKPIPFILNQSGTTQNLIVHLKEKKNGKIVGIVSGFGQSSVKMHQRQMEKEIKEKLTVKGSEIGQRSDDGNQQATAQMFQLPHFRFQPYSIPTQYPAHAHGQHTNFISGAESNAFNREWHQTMLDNAAGRRDGKEVMPEFDGGHESDSPQSVGPKLMQSSINASNRLKIRKQERQQQYLDHNVLKQGKDAEIGSDFRPFKQQKLMHQSMATNWPPQTNLQGHPAEHGNLGIGTGGQFSNEILETFADEYLGKPSELAQFNPSGFTHQTPVNIPPTAGNFVNEQIGQHFDEYRRRQHEFTPSGFIKQAPGNIPPMPIHPLTEESMAEILARGNIVPMNTAGEYIGERQQNLPLHPLTEESVAKILHKYSQIYPTGTSHQGQWNIAPADTWQRHLNFQQNLPFQPMNTGESAQIKPGEFTHQGNIPDESMGYGNLPPIQTAKTSSSSINAAGSQQQQPHGNTSSNIAAPSVEPHFTAIADDEEDSDLSKIFTFDQENPANDIRKYL